MSPLYSIIQFDSTFVNAHVTLISRKKKLELFLGKLLTNKNTYGIISPLRKATSIFGGIAQLGERLNGIQEVRGSTPLISTKRKRDGFTVPFPFGGDIQWESNAVRKQHGVLFPNGDRRILQSISKNQIRDALQNSRTTPLLLE